MWHDVRRIKIFAKKNIISLNIKNRLLNSINVNISTLINIDNEQKTIKKIRDFFFLNFFYIITQLIETQINQNVNLNKKTWYCANILISLLNISKFISILIVFVKKQRQILND